MSEVDDILTEALEGATYKTRDLVNLTFILQSVGPLQSSVIPGHVDKDTGERRPDKTAYSYLAEIVLDGEDEPQGAWLGGGFLTPQVTALKDKGALPVRLKMVMDSTRKGTPFILVSAGEQPVNGVAQVTQGSVSVQHKAVEAFDAARTIKTDLELAELLAELGIPVDFEGDRTVLTEAMLDTRSALALKKALLPATG